MTDRAGDIVAAGTGRQTGTSNLDCRPDVTMGIGFGLDPLQRAIALDRKAGPLPAFADGLLRAVKAYELLTAQALAEDRISALRMLDYILLDDPPDSLLEGVFPPPFEEFTWTAQIELMEDEYDLFGVAVAVEAEAAASDLTRAAAAAVAASGRTRAAGRTPTPAPTTPSRP